MFTLSTTSNNENGEVTYVGMRLRRAYIFSLLTFIMECKDFGVVVFIETYQDDD